MSGCLDGKRVSATTSTLLGEIGAVRAQLAECTARGKHGVAAGAGDVR
jgi:hypothetical protein